MPDIKRPIPVRLADKSDIKLRRQIMRVVEARIGSLLAVDGTGADRFVVLQAESLRYETPVIVGSNFGDEMKLVRTVAVPVYSGNAERSYSIYDFGENTGIIKIAKKQINRVCTMNRFDLVNEGSRQTRPIPLNIDVMEFVILVDVSKRLREVVLKLCDFMTQIEEREIEIITPDMRMKSRVWSGIRSIEYMQRCSTRRQ